MMQMLARLCATLCAAVGLFAAPSVAGATTYTLFDLGMLGAPGEWHRMTATGLNSSGQVVGYASFFSTGAGGELIEATQAWVTGANGIGLSTIPTLGGAWNRANGINDAGWVVGSSLTTGGSQHAFATGPNGASPRDLGTLGGSSSSAADINASGQVVGTSTTAAGIQRGFISDAQAGSLHDLGSLYAGATATSSATAINDAGQVTGTAIANYPLDGTERAFVTGPNGTAMRPVIVPTANGDVPNWGAGINASGQTVGTTSAFNYYQTGFIAEADGSGRLLQLPEIPQGGSEPPFFFLDSRATALNSAGQVVGNYRLGTLADGLFVTGPDGAGGNYLGPEDFVGGTLAVSFYQALAINDAGQIIANAGNGHAYLISPVPEPATLLMMLCGLGGLVWWRRRGKPLPRLSRALGALAACAGLAAAPAAHAVEYALTDLGLLGGFTKVYATGINASGQVVGYGYDGYNGTPYTDTYQAFVTGTDGHAMTAIPTLGGSWSKATGINDSGWVVGTSATTTSTPSGDSRGFVYEGNGSAARSLGTPAGPSTANGISADGRVVGAYTAHGNTQRAYLTDANGGAMHDIGTLGGANSTAFGVNQEGRVVGSAEYRSYASPDTPRQRAFMTGYGGDVMMPIAVTGYDMTGPDTHSVARAINEQGTMVGNSAAFVGDGGRAFIAGRDGIGRVLNLYDMGSFEMAGAWRLESDAFGLNAIGQVAGSYYFTVNMMSHAFISGASGLGLVDVNTLSFTNLAAGARDWLFFDATGINDSGQFITNGTNGHAYLVTPVPEPAAVLMMVCGLGWLAWRRRASIDA